MTSKLGVSLVCRRLRVGSTPAFFWQQACMQKEPSRWMPATLNGFARDAIGLDSPAQNQGATGSRLLIVWTRGLRHGFHLTFGPMS